MNAETFRGGCFCRAIRYKITSQPLDAGTCHCMTCRGVSSAPSLPFVTFPVGHFSICSGKPVTFQSSSHVERTFCAHCGTPLTYFTQEKPSSIDIMTCSLDNPEAFPPRRHVWMSHKLSWDVPGDGLPKYPTTRRNAARNSDSLI
jgi:hypothetical protein